MPARLLRLASNAFALLAGLALAALVVLLVASTSSRYVVGVPLADVEDIAGLLFVAIAFLPMAEADFTDRQIRVQFFVRLFPERAQGLLRAGADALAALVAIIIALETYGFAEVSRRFGSRVVGSDLLLWPWMMIVPAGFALLALIVLARLAAFLFTPQWRLAQ